MYYRKRRNLFEKSECEWHADPAALAFRNDEGVVQRYPWKDVAGVRLSYAPTQIKTWRHIFEIDMKNGKRISIDNAHFKSVGSFEDRSASYVPFVREALARIQAEAPDARVRVGSRPFSYFAQILFVAAAFAALAAVFILLPTPLDAIPGFLIIKALVVLMLLPFFFRWVIHARPRGARLDALPADALPRL